MEYIGRLAKILFLAAVFSGAIILSRFQSIRLNRGFMNMLNYGLTDTQQLQDAFNGRSYQVYYFWCTPKSFEFRNYLSVNSVIKHLDPDKTVFFSRIIPSLMQTFTTRGSMRFVRYIHIPRSFKLQRLFATTTQVRHIVQLLRS